MKREELKSMKKKTLMTLSLAGVLCATGAANMNANISYASTMNACNSLTQIKTYSVILDRGEEIGLSSLISSSDFNKVNLTPVSNSNKKVVTYNLNNKKTDLIIKAKSRGKARLHFTQKGVSINPINVLIDITVV